VALEDVNQQLHAIVSEANLPFADIEAGGVSGRHVRYSHGTTSPDVPPGQQLYLVASVTKAVVASLALKLVGEGRLGLSERVTDRISELPRAPFRSITIRHLLTHTCGLPDQLPGSGQIRASHCSLPEFLQLVGENGTDYTPGADCRYSSMGFLLLGEVISRVVKQPLPAAMHTLVFEPTGMQNSWLGIPADRDDLFDIAVRCELPSWQSEATDWDWNSVYWRRLGVPWGGLLSSTEDLGRFCRMMLNNGKTEDNVPVLTRATVDALAQEQTRNLFNLSETTWRKRPWGYGWRFAWPEHSASFGDLVPRTAVGHWGATGTLLWLDLESQIYVVILTSTPFEKSRFVLQRLSNTIASALL